MRKTKIICTLGPSTDQEGVLRELVANGMNVARFNFSHGSHEEHKGRLDLLKSLREELGKPVAALLDTKGPEIRLKEFKNGVEMLEAGQTFTLTTREVEGTKEICSITYKDLPQDVQPGGTIMLDDGLIKLQIQTVNDTDIVCTVLNNGKPIFQVNGQGEAEDPFLWKDSRGYHVIFKDHVAKFTGERGGGVMAHSDDGIHWTVDKDPKAYSRTVEWEDGKVEMQGQLERPFLLFEDGKATHAFFATMDGPGGFENASKSWNMVIPLK